MLVLDAERHPSLLVLLQEVIVVLTLIFEERCVLYGYIYVLRRSDHYQGRSIGLCSRSQVREVIRSAVARVVYNYWQSHYLLLYAYFLLTPSKLAFNLSVFLRVMLRFLILVFGHSWQSDVLQMV